MGFLSKVGNVLNDVLGTTSAMDAQNRQQWSMWHAQNAYNTPSAQMTRLKEAGLNPMLVYGHGSMAGNTAGSMSAASGSSSGAGLLAALAKSPWTVAKMNQDLNLGQSQIDQVDANKKVALATAGKIKAETDILKNQIDNTPPGMDASGNKGVVERAVRAVYNVGKHVKQKAKSWRDDVYDPRLPALGSNVRR